VPCDPWRRQPARNRRYLRAVARPGRLLPLLDLTTFGGDIAIEYSDYKPVAGLHVPHRIEATDVAGLVDEFRVREAGIDGVVGWDVLIRSRVDMELAGRGALLAI
jgi:hypothetical protein